MSVIFIRVTIESSDQDLIDAEKAWFDAEVDNTELHATLEGGTPNSSIILLDRVGDAIDPLFVFDIYVVDSVDADAYKTSFGDRLTSLDKTDVSLAECCHNDTCDHDEATSNPDTVILGYEYP